METKVEDYGEPTDYFTDTQVAAMLGSHPVTMRKWRTKNKAFGAIKFGPPYEYRGSRVVYPKEKFRAWCSQVQLVDGVPRFNLPITAHVALPSSELQRSTVNEVDNVAQE